MTDNKWIKWNGGEWPVDKNCKVDYKLKLKDGDTFTGKCAGCLYWYHHRVSTDITKYRLHKPSESLSDTTDTKPQDSTENVSQSITDAFKTIQELCIEKGVAIGINIYGNVEIHTSFGSYVIDTEREDLVDVINKMADVNEIVKGGFNR